MRFRMVFDLEDLDSGEILTERKQVEFEFTDVDLRALPHVKRGKFVNEGVQKAFLACLHYIRNHIPLMHGCIESPVVSNSVRGSYTDVS